MWYTVTLYTMWYSVAKLLNKIVGLIIRTTKQIPPSIIF
jgi:hypothetical protein